MIILLYVTLFIPNSSIPTLLARLIKCQVCRTNTIHLSLLYASYGVDKNQSFIVLQYSPKRTKNRITCCFRSQYETRIFTGRSKLVTIIVLFNQIFENLTTKIGRVIRICRYVPLITRTYGFSFCNFHLPIRINVRSKPS